VFSKRLQRAFEAIARRFQSDCAAVPQQLLIDSEMISQRLHSAFDGISQQFPSDCGVILQ
jgi:hypothetical protein